MFSLSLKLTFDRRTDGFVDHRSLINFTYLFPPVLFERMDIKIENRKNKYWPMASLAWNLRSGIDYFIWRLTIRLLVLHKMHRPLSRQAADRGYLSLMSEAARKWNVNFNHLLSCIYTSTKLIDHNGTCSILKKSRQSMSCLLWANVCLCFFDRHEPRIDGRRWGVTRVYF